MAKHNSVIVALDYHTARDALNLIDQVQGIPCKFKIGFELFVAEGPRFVEQLAQKDLDIFLDLKLHDIPNTVAQACLAAANLGVWMINVHAAGGKEMMVAAKEALVSKKLSTKLVAVTVLTSLASSDLSALGTDLAPLEYACHLAELSHQCGLDGVVCSVHEASAVRNQTDAQFLLVTPGVRLVTNQAHDQKRVATPQQAKNAGVDYIVVGRPITRAQDPCAALHEIATNFA